MSGTYWLADSEASPAGVLDKVDAVLAPGVARRAHARSLGHLGAVGDQLADCAGVHVAGSVRLDNRAALCGRLRLDSSSADADIVAAAWARWREDLGPHLAGDFAITIVDEERSTVFCLRDISGSRPLYYWSAGGRLAGVASAPAVPLATAAFKPRLEPAAAVDHLLALHRDHEGTLLRGLWRLPPGHQLRWGPGTPMAVRSFTSWREAGDRCSTADEWAEALRAAVEQAVTDRMRGSSTVGSHVSGGLDSSAVTALAADALGSDRLRAISFSAEPSAMIHGRRSLDGDRLLALDIPIHYATAGPSDRCAAPGMMPPSYSPTRAHVWAASEGVTTMLSGWGGDEVASFNGRDAIVTLLSQGHLRRSWRTYRAVGPRVRSPRHYLTERLLDPLLPDWLLWGLAHARKAPTVGRLERSVVDVGAATEVGALDAYRHPLRIRPGHGRTQRALVESAHLTDRVESWSVDAARCGITYAHPLLDTRVVGTALAAPADLFLWQGWDRWLFRKAMQPHLPAEVVWHRGKVDSVMQAAEAARGAARPETSGFFERLHQLVADRDDLGGIVDLTTVNTTLDRLSRADWPLSSAMDRRQLAGLRLLVDLVEYVERNAVGT